MAGKLTLESYQEKLNDIYKGTVIAKAYLGIHVKVRHRCTKHRITFEVAPNRAIYRYSATYRLRPYPKPVCPKCLSELPSRSEVTRAAKAPKRKEVVLRCLKLVRKHRVIELEQTLDELLVKGKITYTCLNCGSTANPTNLSAAARNKHGCRRCTNAYTNAKKRISEKEALRILRARFPEVRILRMSGKGRSGSKNTSAGKCVIFQCPECGEEVRRARFPFERADALRLCKTCTDDHVVRTGRHTAFSKSVVTEKETGKRFVVQGYELLALKQLKAQGLNMRKLIPSQDVPIVPYVFEGKSRRYFPDLQYGNTLIEVKSVYTAGITGWSASSNYRGFRMLKAKALACINLGYQFRLMLFVGSSTGLEEALLPDDWFYLKACKLRKLLGLT